MAQKNAPLRRFRVRARHIADHHARLIDEASFEAAATAYLDDVDMTISVTDEQGLKIHVLEIATGHEHCFHIDLDEGVPVACG